MHLFDDDDDWNRTHQSDSDALLTEFSSLEIPNTWHFLMLPHVKTMACFNYKVASSSLKNVFQLASRRHLIDGSNSVSQQRIPTSVEDFREANASYFKFTVVRHPMDRLLSCYIDKLLNNRQYFASLQDDDQQQSFPYLVKQKARQLIVKNNLTHRIPTFQEFLEFVLASPSFEGICWLLIDWLILLSSRCVQVLQFTGRRTIVTALHLAAVHDFRLFIF